MNNQYRSTGSASTSGRESQSHAPEPAAQGVRAKAEDAVSKLTDVAQQAGSQAKQSATSMAADATQGAKRFLDDSDRRGSRSRRARRRVPSAVRPTSSSRTRRNSPAWCAAGAEGVERFSREMREQSAQDLWRTASDFTRNQPAVVFGLASLAGFLLFRVLKANSTDGERSDRQYPRTQSYRED